MNFLENDLKMDGDPSNVGDPQLPKASNESGGKQGSDDCGNAGSSSNLEHHEPQYSQEALGKRKRDDGDDDEPESSLFILEENDMVPENGFTAEDNEGGAQDSKMDDDIEESDDDMDEDHAPRVVYDPSSEHFPKCAIYDEELPQITLEFTKIPQKLSELLQQDGCNSGHVELQRMAADKLKYIPSTKKLRIALLGDAGAGKSSVLNSITDIPDLAKSLSGGQSCTCVSTDYSGAYSWQQKYFAARIFYFSIKEIRGLLEELLEDYNVFAFQRDEDWDEETVTAFQRKMQNALRTFTTLFCDLAEFQDLKAAKASLKKAYEEGRATLLATMMESAEEKLKDKLTPKGGYAEYREAATRAKLREAVDPLVTSKTNFDQPALWPLVRRVCIGVRGSRVLDRLTIIDLPGLSDTNESRVNLTKDYVKTCDYLFIVANISRVVDDGMVNYLLSKYGKIFKGKVAVICTHADDGVDSKLVRHLQDQGVDVSNYRQLSEQFKTKKTEVTRLKALIKQRRNRKSNTKAQLLEIQKLGNDLSDMRTEWAKIENSKFASIVKARNAFVTTQLQNEMEFHLPDGIDLNVFCVSNSHYAAAKGLASIRGAKLAGDVTGIPALRSFALKLPASKLLQTLNDYSKDYMLVYLKDLALWVNKTAVERRQDLMHIVEQPRECLPTRMVAHKTTFPEELETNFSIPMREQQACAVDAALRVHAQKNNKHGSTIRAFIRKNGLHSTKLCPKECWNEQFSKVLIDFVTFHWPQLESSREEIDAKLEDRCMEDLRAVMKQLRAHLCANMLPLDSLAGVIDANIVSIRNIFRRYSEAYEQDLRNIQLDVTQHSDKNYFSRSMQHVYDECNADVGKGVTGRSMNKLKAHLEKNSVQSPFAIMEENVASALVKNNARHVDLLEKAIHNIFARVVRSFDRTIDRKIDDPTEKPVRERIKKALPEMEKGYVLWCTRLEDIEAKYPV